MAAMPPLRIIQNHSGNYTAVICCDTTEAQTSTTNKVFIARCNRIKQSKEIQLYGRLHSDFCIVPLYFLPGVRLQIKLTKARSDFYLMNKTSDPKTTFKFLDARLLVNRIRPKPAILLAHNSTLRKGGIARHKFTRAELKTFTYITPFWESSPIVLCSPW